MPIARGIRVPLTADGVGRPDVIYSAPMTCLLFPVADDPDHVGRVTFEGFDSLRVCRGEYLPYADDWAGDEDSPYPWVFEVDGSDWLGERHR